MKKRTLQIIIIVISLIILLVYGWNLFRRLSHNRLVFVTSVEDYIPSETKSVVYFNRNYHLAQYFEHDTTNVYLLDPIKDYITYPLLITQFEKGEDLLLMRATKEQEEDIKNIFYKRIALFHTPKIKKVKDSELFFYSLPNNDFITLCFHKGVLAISKDYIKIENFVESTSKSVFFNTNNAQLNHYMLKTKENAAVSLFTHTNNSTFALSYLNKDSHIYLEGEYFGDLENDSLKLSYNEMNSLLQLDQHYTDSISWGERNKIQIWINKVEE